jgi:hypothetical protein
MTTTMNQARMRRVLLALWSGVGLALSGCDGGDSVEQAIARAAVDLSALSPNGAPAASDQLKETVYKRVLTTLQGQAGKGTPSQNSAAFVLLSKAQTGLAAFPAAGAATIERGCQHTQRQLRTVLDQWQTLSAQGSALASYDPAPELNELARQVQEREASIKREQARKAEVDARVADLRNQAASKAAEAKGKRQEEGRIQQRMSGVSAVEGEALLRQAVAVRRQADALDGEAADLTARAAQVAPQSDQIQLEIDRLTAQRGLLLKARDEVNLRAKEIGERASVARDEARKAADSIAALTAELEKARQGLTYDDAVRQYETAAGTAKKASTEPGTRGSAELASGIAQQSLGDVYWSQAHGLAQHAALYDALANARPPLPDATQYKARHDEAQRALQAALEGATNAYSAAAAAYKNAGGSPQVKERLEAVIKRLSVSVKATSDGKKDLMAELGLTDTVPESAPAGSDPAGAGTAEADQTTPAGTIQLAINYSREKRWNDLAGLFYFPSEQDRGVFTQVMTLAPKMDRLNEACKARFGSGLDGLGANMGGIGEMGLGGLEDFSASDFAVTVTGDTATAMPRGGAGQSLNLRQVAGKWLLDFELPSMTGGQNGGATAAMMAAMMGPMGQAVDELTAEVQAGKYGSIQDVIAALGQKMQAAMMKSMTRPPGGG